MNTKVIQLGFALGRDYALSVAEIFAYFCRQGVKSELILYDKDILIVEISENDKDKISINNLGGTIKLFEVLGASSDITDIKQKLIDIVPIEAEKRVNFGVSGYGKLNKKVVLGLGYEIKDNLVAAGYKARFVTGKSLDLSSVIVHENKLIERGFEAILLKSDDRYLLGCTLAVQDYKSYSKRDYGRPRRNDRNGMLPPKLAQILVNLAEKPLDAAIYDPFCGSGTTLQEAILLGYKDIYGSDIAESNIEDTRLNLDWLRHIKDYKVPTENIFVSDVLVPARDIKVDAIVGEGYLGEPTRRDKDQAVKDTAELTGFYIKALTNLAAQLKPNGRIVLAIPFFIVGTEYFYLPILEKLAETGLKLVKPNLGGSELRLFGRGNLTYSRADQFVGREIIILEK